MILLDTDHCTVLKYAENLRSIKLKEKMDQSEPASLSIVTVEEQLRGWLSAIGRERDIQRQVNAYRELADLLQFFSGFDVVTFDAHAADHFERLRKQRIRIGTMDLKIASIALTHDALLVTANLRDFQQVPGLRCECWLDMQ